MTDLVVCAGEDRNNWPYISKLIEAEKWEKIVVVATSGAKEGLSFKKPVDIILLDEKKMLADMIEELSRRMHKKFGLEVGLNMVSGTGKHHMAVLAALLKLGVGIRLAVLTPEGIKEV